MVHAWIEISPLIGTCNLWCMSGLSFGTRWSQAIIRNQVGPMHCKTLSMAHLKQIGDSILSANQCLTHQLTRLALWFTRRLLIPKLTIPRCRSENKCMWTCHGNGQQHLPQEKRRNNITITLENSDMVPLLFFLAPISNLLG